MGMPSAAAEKVLLPHLFPGGKRPDGAAPPSPTHLLHKATAQARGSPGGEGGVSRAGTLGRGRDARARGHPQHRTAAASCFTLGRRIAPSPLPAPRRAALHRCARSAARRPPLSSAAPPPAPPQPLAHWLQECLAPPLGAGPLLGRARGWGPKLGEASCGHRELLLCQPRNRQLQRKAREEASSSGRGPWLGGTGSLGWNIEIIARGLGVGWFVGLL